MSFIEMYPCVPEREENSLFDDCRAVTLTVDFLT